jgi:hypothetical protein
MNVLSMIAIGLCLSKVIQEAIHAYCERAPGLRGSAPGPCELSRSIRLLGVKCPRTIERLPTNAYAAPS